MPLGLPVDGSVPVSNLAAQPTEARVRWADGSTAGLEGGSVAGGFPLLRLESGQADRLFVYHGIPDMRLVGGTDALAVPQDAFAHTDPHALVILEARLASGEPLPAWLSFDGARGEFAGTPPQGWQDLITEVEVIARDTEGHEAHAFFALQIDTQLGLDVDKQEAEKAEKARLEAAREAALARPAGAGGSTPQRQGSASFSDQLAAAKAKDPLLERIARLRGNR